MKKNKGLLSLILIVLVLGLYAFFGEYRREIQETAQKNEQNRILKFKKDQIQKVKIITKGETLELHRSLDGWDVKSPFSDQADSETVDSLIEQLSNEKSVDRISWKDNLQLSEYGLEPPAGSLVFTDNSGAEQVIQISSRKNFENLQYLRVEPNKDILTSGDSWFSFLAKPAQSFRNLKLLRAGISKITEISISNNIGQFQIVNKDARWISKKDSFELDQNAVREMLTQIGQAKATEIMQSHRPRKKPFAEIQLMVDQNLWRAEIFEDKETKDVIANVSKPQMILRFSPQTLEKLRDMNLQSLRERSRPFEFDKQKVTSIEWGTGLKKQGIKKTGGTWGQEPPDPQFRVDPKIGDLLLDRIRNLKVYRYQDQRPKKIEFNNFLNLLDESGKVIFTFKWSEFKDFEAWAQSSHSDEIFQMDDAQINRLGLLEVIQNLPPKENDAKN